MGGTVPSISPPKAAPFANPLPFFNLRVGRGEATRAGGARTFPRGDSGAGAGGVGNEGTVGVFWLITAALGSSKGRAVIT